MSTAVARGALAAVCFACSAGLAVSEAPAPGTRAESVDWDRVKRDWDELGPSARAAYEKILEEWISRVAPARPKTAGDSCTQATFEVSMLPFSDSGTTAGKLDHAFLSGGGACAGGGAQFGGTGFGSDVAYRVKVDVDCELRVTLQPLPPLDPGMPEASPDLSLYVVTDCALPATTCVRVDDSGGRGVAESLSFAADSETTYFILVDAYNLMSGEYQLGIEEVGGTGCRLVPVELQRFSVE